MSTFTQFQQKAEFLPIKLHQSYSKLYTQGGFFCSYLPFVRLHSFDEAYLIQGVAQCLNYYSTATEKEKLSVLKGIYLYILERYESSLQRVLNKPFLDLLNSHLKLDSLEKIDKEAYEEIFQALDAFCNWVYRNRSHPELGELYRAFPNDMQVNIHMRPLLLQESETSSWGCSINKLIEDIGINRLF